MVKKSSELKRASREKERHISGFVSATILLLVCLVVAWSMDKQMADLTRLPSVDGRTFRQAGVGVQLLVTGHLAQNVETEAGLVAYEQQKWVMRDGIGCSVHYGWETISQSIPDMRVEIPGGLIDVRRPAEPFRLEGKLYDAAERGTDKISTSKNEVVIRTVGLRNGDLITLIGQKHKDGYLLPDMIYGGSREDYLGEKKVQRFYLSLFISGLAGFQFFMRRALDESITWIQSVSAEP